jgi:MFS family permease
MPARQAFIVNMVTRDDLVNAISLNASLFHASRVIGPAVAGFIVAKVGEGLCFSLNAVSFLAALLAILLIRVDRPTDAHATAQAHSGIAKALQFAFTTPGVRSILGLAAVVSLFGMQFLVLMPVVASVVLHREVGTLGALMAGASVGSCVAALTLANRATGELLERGVGYACLGFSVALFCFAMSDNVYLSITLSVPLGFFITAQLSGSHSLLQLAVSDQLRGRVSSIWMMNMLGLLPLGSLLIGWLAHRYGAPAALEGCAVVCAIAGLAYLFENSRRC